MRPFHRTIRQRGRRARKGQVSAVATVLGLLLVVSFISNYLATQLPGQMSAAEFAHDVQVEDQLSQLRATILAQTSLRGMPYALSTPITLGSGAVPPFGTPALGSIGPEFSSTNTTAAETGYRLDTVSPATPNWGADSSCLPAGAGTCSTTTVIDYANVSENHTTLAVSITGSDNSLVYNLNGNNDTLTISWSGSNEELIEVVVNGSYDTVTLNKANTDSTVPSMSFAFYGIHDTYAMSMAGSHSSAGGASVFVSFVGSVGLLCPYDNNSATDKVGALGAGGTKLNLSVTWWNAVGYQTPPSSQAYPGGTVPSEEIFWENSTGFTACPFLRIDSSQYDSSYFGALLVTLSNHYIPIADLGYEDGAVLLANPASPAVMVSPPDFYFNETAAGLAATLTLVQFSGAIPSESGVTTALLTTKILSVSTSAFGRGVNGIYVGTPYYLNLTTDFPGAWVAYFNANPEAFPYGATCVDKGAPLPSGSTCLTPPLGTPVTIIAPLYAQQVKVTVIQVSLGIE